MKIGLFMGKEIADMNREELLQFAIWSSKQIQGLQRDIKPFEEIIIHREVIKNLTNN